MGNVLFFLLVVIAIIIVVTIQSSNNMKIANQKRDNIKKELESDGFNIDTEYWNGDILFLVDSSREMIAVSDNCLKNKMVPFSEIIGCEIIEDSRITGGVGRAVVGGVLAGGVGAVVGATTARSESIISYEIVIYRENIDDPRMVLQILKSKTKTSSYIYDNAVKFANNVNATIKAITSKNSKSQTNNNAAIGFKDRLIQLEDLKKSGLINSDEYEQKRNEIIESV